ncbi:MAG: surface-adhesin E family protein [Burkholderiaceae bacterium]
MRIPSTLRRSVASSIEVAFSALFLLAAPTTSCFAEEPETDIDLLRARAIQAATAGCVTALVDRTVDAMLVKAKARGMDNLTEAEARALIERPALRRGIEGVCACVTATVRDKFERAKTSEEIQEIAQRMQTDPALAAPDMEAIGACGRKALRSADLSDNAGARRWTPIGRFPDGEAYVDERSVEALGDDKVKVWTRAVFAQAKPLDDIQVLSLNTLSIYDCREEKSAMAGYVAYRDRDATQVGAQSLRSDAAAEAKFSPLPGGSGDIARALRDWACTHVPSR